jgi:hypothetical protein
LAEVQWDVAVRQAPDVLMQRLEDESVFLNLATEEYFGLDAIGTAMWEALIESGRIDRAYRRLLDEFDIDPEVLRRDLDGLVRTVSQRGLLQIGEDEGRTLPPAERD